jgi:hypothetical protein
VLAGSLALLTRFALEVLRHVAEANAGRDAYALANEVIKAKGQTADQRAAS